MRALTINALAFMAGFFITRLFFPRPGAVSPQPTQPTQARPARPARTAYARDRDQDPAPAAPKATAWEDDAFVDSYTLSRQRELERRRSMAAHPSNQPRADFVSDPSDLSALDNPLDGTDPLPDIDDGDELSEDDAEGAIGDLATMTTAARIYVADDTDDEDRTLLEACEHAFRNIDDWREIAEQTPVDDLCLPTVGTAADAVIAASTLTDVVQMTGQQEEIIEAGNEGLAELLLRFETVATQEGREELHQRIISRYDAGVNDSWHRLQDGNPINNITSIMMLGRAMSQELALMGIDV